MTLSLTEAIIGGKETMTTTGNPSTSTPDTATGTNPSDNDPVVSGSSSISLMPLNTGL
jgi:hypothetical protein